LSALRATDRACAVSRFKKKNSEFKILSSVKWRQ